MCRNVGTGTIQVSESHIHLLTDRMHEARIRLQHEIEIIWHKHCSLACEQTKLWTAFRFYGIDCINELQITNKSAKFC